MTPSRSKEPGNRTAALGSSVPEEPSAFLSRGHLPCCALPACSRQPGRCIARTDQVDVLPSRRRWTEGPDPRWAVRVTNEPWMRGSFAGRYQERPRPVLGPRSLTRSPNFGIVQRVGGMTNAAGTPTQRMQGLWATRQWARGGSPDGPAGISAPRSSRPSQDG
jgi:hypothetical protein